MIKIKNKLKKLTYTNIKSYIVGTLRYKLYYSKYKKFIRKHILEQIDFRIDYMEPECFNNGVCIKCGCTTTALQMANKSCNGECYPIMMDKKTWYQFKEHNPIEQNKTTWILDVKNDILIKRKDLFTYGVITKTEKTK